MPTCIPSIICRRIPIAISAILEVLGAHENGVRRRFPRAKTTLCARLPPARPAWGGSVYAEDAVAAWRSMFGCIKPILAATPARSIGLPRPATVSGAARSARKFIPEHSETYICHHLPRIQTFRSNNFYARDYPRPVQRGGRVGICRRRRGRMAQHVRMHKADLGRDAGALDRLAEASDCERCRPQRAQIHPRAFGNLHLSPSAANSDNSDQIIKSEHGGDRSAAEKTERLLGVLFTAQDSADHPAWVALAAYPRRVRQVRPKAPSRIGNFLRNLTPDNPLLRRVPIMAPSVTR